MSHVSILFRSDLFASLIIAGGTGHFLKDQGTKPAVILPYRPDCLGLRNAEHHELDDRPPRVGDQQDPDLAVPGLTAAAVPSCWQHANR